MSAEAAQNEPRVIVIANAAGERCAQICRALGAGGIDVIRLPNVYVALGEIAADSNPATRAVVVQAAGLDSTEMEFFSLASRHIRGNVYVFAESVSEDPAFRAAVAAGATGLGANDLCEWAEGLAETPPAPATDNADDSGETPRFTPPDVAARPQAPIPEPIRDEPAEPPPRDVGPVESNKTPPAAVDEIAVATEAPTAEPAEQPAAAVEDRAPAIEARAPESKPISLPDIRVARPIAIPHEWPLRPGSPQANDAGPTTDDTTIPAVPWRPSANRPMRTPPSARAAEPVPPDRLGSDVELTHEELDALLGSPTDTPESRRDDR